MQMENFIDDLPLPIDFEQSEKVGEAVSGPVIQFEPHGRYSFDDVDTGNASL